MSSHTPLFGDRGFARAFVDALMHLRLGKQVSERFDKLLYRDVDEEYILMALFRELACGTSLDEVAHHLGVSICLHARSVLVRRFGPTLSHTVLDILHLEGRSYLYAPSSQARGVLLKLHPCEDALFSFMEENVYGGPVDNSKVFALIESNEHIWDVHLVQVLEFCAAHGWNPSLRFGPKRLLPEEVTVSPKVVALCRSISPFRLLGGGIKVVRSKNRFIQKALEARSATIDAETKKEEAWKAADEYHTKVLKLHESTTPSITLGGAIEARHIGVVGHVMHRLTHDLQEELLRFGGLQNFLKD